MPMQMPSILSSHINCGCTKNDWKPSQQIDDLGNVGFHEFPSLALAAVNQTPRSLELFKGAAHFLKAYLWNREPTDTAHCGTFFAARYDEYSGFVDERTHFRNLIDKPHT